MKTTKQTRSLQEMKNGWQSSSTKTIITNATKTILVTALLVWAKPAMPQTQKTDPGKDSTQTELPKKSENTWVFFIEPAYSPTAHIGTTRLAWWSSVHGLKIGGLLDLTGTEKEPLDINSAGGKVTISSPTSKVIKGVSWAIEYTFSTQAKDQLRWWVVYVHAIKNGTVVLKWYPVSDQWFEPFVFVGADKKFGKFKVSAFWSTDIKSKGFYGELDASYQATKQIYPFIQGRFGGTYTGKVNPNAYIGMRVKL